MKVNVSSKTRKELLEAAWRLKQATANIYVPKELLLY
jgi:hypothetical protein